MAKIRKLNHVAVAVNDITEALDFWEKALGIKLGHVEDVSSQKVKVASHQRPLKSPKIL